MDDREEYMSSWYDMLKNIMEKDGEDFDKRICTLSEEELKIRFDAGFGGGAYNDDPDDIAKPFTAWGEKWVYFPLQYDGSLRVGHAPRNPCKYSMRPQ